MSGLPPLRRILDPRPEPEALERPFVESVNIPCSELERRLHELPSRQTVLHVAEAGECTREAIAWLASGGRTARTVPALPARSAEPGRLWSPNAWLEEVLPQLSAGAAVDLGCGSGREAVALTAAGWTVTAIDRLEDALDKGRDLERRTLGATGIEWCCTDVESDGYAPSGAVELVACFAYLHRPLLLAAGEWLAPGGNLIVETFTAEHRARFGKPRTERFVLEPNELPRLAAGLEIVHHSELWRDDGRHTARLWARRKTT